MTEETQEPPNVVPVILRRLEQKFDAMAEQQEATNKKLDKLFIEVTGVKGRVRKLEEAVATISRVMSVDATI